MLAFDSGEFCKRLSILGAARRPVGFRDETSEIMRFFAEIFVAQVQTGILGREIAKMLFEFPLFIYDGNIFKSYLFKLLALQIFSKIDGKINVLLLELKLNRKKMSMYSILYFGFVLFFTCAVVYSENKGGLFKLIKNDLGVLIFTVSAIGILMYVTFTYILIASIFTKYRYFRCIAILLLSANKAQAQEYIVTLTSFIGASNTNLLVDEVKKRYGADFIRYP